jgi:hypothetical protein
MGSHKKYVHSLLLHSKYIYVFDGGLLITYIINYLVTYYYVQSSVLLGSYAQNSYFVLQCM